MKYLIALTLALSSIAHAQTFIASNESGGGIVLTSRPCPNPAAPNLREAYAFNGNGARLGGCWGLLDGFVHIVYDDGDHRVYNTELFRQVGEQPKKKSDSI